MIHFNRPNLFDLPGNSNHVEATSASHSALAEMPEELLLELSPLLKANDVLALSLTSKRLHRVFDEQLQANQAAMEIKRHAGSLEEYGLLHQSHLDFVENCNDSCSRRTVLTALAERVWRNQPALINEAWHQILNAVRQLPLSAQIQPLEALVPWLHVPQELRWGMFNEVFPLATVHKGKGFVPLFGGFVTCLDTLPDEFVGQAFGLLLEQVHKLEREDRLIGLGMLMLRIERVPADRALQAFDAIDNAWVEFASVHFRVHFLGLLITCLPQLPENHFQTRFDRVAQAVESTPEDFRAQLLWTAVEQIPYMSADGQQEVHEWVLTAADQLPLEAQNWLIQKMLSAAHEAP